MLGESCAGKDAPCLGKHCVICMLTADLGGPCTTDCCAKVLLMRQHPSLCACRLARIRGASVQQHRSSHAEAGQHPAQPQVLSDAGAPAGHHQGSL